MLGRTSCKPALDNRHYYKAKLLKEAVIYPHLGLCEKLHLHGTVLRHQHRVQGRAWLRVPAAWHSVQLAPSSKQGSLGLT